MDDFDGVGAGDLMTLEECAAEIGDLADKLEAERERVRVLRDAIEAALPVLDGPEYRVLEHALATTAPEAGEEAK